MDFWQEVGIRMGTKAVPVFLFYMRSICRHCSSQRSVYYDEILWYSGTVLQ